MGMPLRLENFLLENKLTFQRFAAFDLSDELLAKLDGLLARVGRMGKEVDALFQDVAAQGLAYQDLVAKARQEVPAGGPDNLDQLIDTLSSIETKYAVELRPRIKRANKYITAARKDDALVSAGLIPVVQKEVEAMRLAIEQVRDTRWQLMAVKAEVSKGTPSPATENAAELRVMLKRLKG